ncbi:hypothetical protein EC968_002708 [Mortierella alpina]|nr:hypothetical protein EC968_002708 [Mortierella alpina]
MHQIRGQSLPKTFLENPYEKRSAGSSSSKTHTKKTATVSSSSSSTHDPAAKGKEKEKEREKELGEDKAKSTKLKKSKSKKEEKGISSMVGASLMTTTMFLPPATAAAASPTAAASPALISSASGRDRSSSLTSQNAKYSIGATNKDEQHASASGAPLTQQSSTTITTTTTTTTTTATPALLPPLLPRTSLDNSSVHSIGSPVAHGHSHIRLPSIFKRRKHSSATTASLESSSSSTHSLALPSTSTSLKQQQHSILMAPQHDITITWPYAVPSGQAFIAGTWSVPGHGPWEKLPMSLVPGTTDKYEVSLNVQEVEDISDYFDEDGYLHHELLEHHTSTTTATPAITATTAPSSPATPGSTPHTTLSKRQRIRRFFGRARSSSTTSNSATANNNNSTNVKEDVLHQDLPYHHQSKDGIILPLSREYRYQYKFVIDDEWKCDPNRPQVQDSEGHWNHELAVELIEQIHQRPTTASMLLLDAVTNRSRSSSLQSQLTAPPVSKEVGEEGEAAAVKQDQAAEVKQDHVEVLTQPLDNDADEAAETETETRDIHSPPPPPYSAPLVPLTADAAADDKVIVSKPKVRAPKPPKDTFEAVLIFDETDDLSDGEGGRVLRGEIDDESDYDDDDDDDDEHAEVQQQQQPSQEEVQQQQIVGDGDAAGVVTPQQADDHGKEQPQHADNDQDAALLLSTAAATAAAAITVDAAVEDPVAQQAREQDVLEREPEVATSVEEEAVAGSVLPLDDDAHEAHREDTFKLQAAANPEEHDSVSHPIVSSDDESEAKEELVSARTMTKESSRAGLEVVTDNAAVAAALAGAAATTAAAASYSQVPSPPLTPSKDHREQYHSDKNLETEQTTETRTEPDAEEKSYVPLTPRSEATLFKLTSTHEDEKTFDVLEDNDDHSSIHLRSQSSSSLLPGSSLASKQKREQDQSVESTNATKKAGPDHYPNLIWSICKTTAVVSAAVVVLGFGLGRRRS